MKKTIVCLLTIVFIAICHHSYSQEASKADSAFSDKDFGLPAVTWNINPIGIALYGPIIQMEFKVSDRSFVVPWLRYSYAGIVSTYEWTNFEDFNKYDPSSIAFAAGFKSFLPGDEKLENIYFGFFGEFIHEKGLKDTDVTGYEYEQTHMAVAVYGNLGYRWHSKQNFYVSLGILPGFAYDIKNEGTFTNNGGPKPGIEKKNRFIGMLDLSFGWNIKN